jgi:hypothetical protein
MARFTYRAGGGDWVEIACDLDVTPPYDLPQRLALRARAATLLTQDARFATAERIAVYPADADDATGAPLVCVERGHLIAA